MYYMQTSINHVVNYVGVPIAWNNIRHLYNV